MSVRQKNPWLDLVRCAAVILVLLRHGERALADPATASPSFFQAVRLNGWIGVDLFFALSGYLIARHLIGAGLGTSVFAPGRYLMLRALRIVPAYFAVMMLAVAGAFPFFSVDGADLPFRIGYHLLFLQDYLGSDINVVFWSLGVEEKFYLVAPLLVLALLRLRGSQAAVLLALLFVLPILFRLHAWWEWRGALDYTQFFREFRSPFHMTIEGLVGGVAVAVAEKAGLVRSNRRAGAMLLAASSFLLLCWAGSHDFMARLGAFDVLVQPALVALLASSVTLGAVMLGGAPMQLAPAAGWLARTSYCLYLVHLPLIPAALALASGSDVGFWVIYPALGVAAAVLLHRTVEQPFLLWKDRLSFPGKPRLVATTAAS